MRQVFILAHDVARKRAVQAVQNAPEGAKVTVAEGSRTLEQNAVFHALCNDAEKMGLKWAGRARTADEWKLLFISGHAVATKREVEIVPGLEGEWVNLRESTAAMSKSRGSSLIEYTQAYLANHDE